MRFGLAVLAVIPLANACALEADQVDGFALEVDLYDSKSDTLITQTMYMAPTGYYRADKNNVNSTSEMSVKVQVPARDAQGREIPNSFRVEGPLIQLGPGSALNTRLSVTIESPWNSGGYNWFASDSLFVTLMKDINQTRSDWAYALAWNRGNPIRSALWRSIEVDPRAAPSWGQGIPAGKMEATDYDNRSWSDLSFPIVPDAEYGIFAVPVYDPGSADGEVITSTITVSR